MGTDLQDGQVGVHARDDPAEYLAINGLRQPVAHVSGRFSGYRGGNPIVARFDTTGCESSDQGLGIDFQKGADEWQIASGDIRLLQS